MNEENKKVIVRKKKNGKKQLLVLALAGVLGCGGVLGASAFFTDHETTQATAKAGTFNMKVTDMSDLDGQYSDWSTGTQVKKLTAEGKQATDFVLPEAYDKANPSTGIINPGDTGIYAYKVENKGEKSMDTAKTVKVKVALKADSTDTLDKTADADAYAIKGLGTPVILMGDDNKSMTLYYASADTEVLSGSKEADGAADNVIYAYNADFNRLAQNKFQAMDVTVDTTVYAKQHRNALTSTLAVNNAATTEADVFTGTGDWAEIANFETVANA